MSIFTSKIFLEIFGKNSAVKIWSKNDEEIKVSPQLGLSPIQSDISQPKYYKNILLLTKWAFDPKTEKYKVHLSVYSTWDL